MKAIMIAVMITVLSIELASCKSIPVEALSSLTPVECRAYGVDIADEQIITGTIVHSEFSWNHELYRECNPGNVAIAGCAKPVEGVTLGTSVWRSPTHQYEIWYSDHKCVPEHEACHALYEEWNHTVKFFTRQVQGDVFAACPTNDTMPQFQAPFINLNQQLLSTG